MESKEGLIKKLKSNERILKFQIETSDNEKRLARGIVKLGLAIDKILPLIVAGTFCFCAQKTYDTFYRGANKVEFRERLNDSLKNSFYFEGDFDDYIEYSTGWKKTSDGYVRTITAYSLKETVDINDLIFKKENSIEKLLEKVGTSTVYQKELDEQDHFYDEDVLIIPERFQSDIKEGRLNNPYFNKFTILLLSGELFLGRTLLVRKRVIKDRLHGIESILIPLSEEEKEYYKKILEQQRENLEFMGITPDEAEKENSNKHIRILAKRLFGDRNG